MRICRIGLVAALLLALPAGANAQTWTERFHVSFNGGGQTTANDFQDRFQFEQYLETGTTDVDYEGQGGVFFDGGVGVRLWKDFGAGVAYSRFSRDNPANTDSRVPHPFHDNRPREVSGEARSLKRTDGALHLQAMYLVDLRGPMRLVLFGGPSFFRVEQEVVTLVRYAETYPYDTASFSAADTRSLDHSAVGFNAGADVIWMFHRNVGAGGLLRFTRASLDLEIDNRSVSLDAGGFQVGGGVRVTF